MAVRFTNEHTSWAVSTPITWKIEIHDSSHVGDSTDFEVADGAEINYRATGDSIFAPIVGSSLSFSMMIQDSTHEDLITDMAGASEGRFTVVLYKNTVFHWAGVINSPEINIEDWDFPYSFRITAVDGLALLKNYEYRQDGTSATKYDLRYEGIDKITDILLRCLQKLPHVVTHYTGATKFLVNAINWYSSDHTVTPAGATYDPFYYTQLDNRFAVTGQSSGNAKFLSCYDVVAQILTAFNARIALFDGYFLVEQIEHRAYTIGSNDNYSRYYAYDGTGPTANTLTADQDVGGSQTIKKLRGGSYSFVQAAGKCRVKQNINSLANLLSGYYFDSGTVETVTVEDVFGDGLSTYVRFSGSVEWTFENLGVASPGTIPFIARFRVKLQLGSKYAQRLVTYDDYGNWTYSQLTWENSTAYIEIPVKLTIPGLADTWTGSTPVDIMFPTDSAFTSGDMVVSVEFIEINYYILGVETLLDPSDYDLDWTFRDPYAAIIYSPKKVKTAGLTPGAINPKSATYEVIGSSSNTETVELETLIGDRIGTVLNQWGGLLFDDSGDYVYTSAWGVRNGTRDRTIAQLLAKRVMDFLYYPKRTYRGTVAGSTLSIQVPITDQSTTETYLLQSGVYSTHRDELAGEWTQLQYETPELTYAPVEYDTEGYEKATAGGGASGGNVGPDNGGNGSAGSTGGNGIYGGSGTVADGTIAAMSGDFTFSNSGATAGEAFSVSVDDGTNSSLVRVQATDGILLQAIGDDSIQLQGITRLTDIITSASLGSDQNDYAGFDGANVGRLTASTAVNITGIDSGVDGRILALHNVGSNPITLVNSSASSSAANRFDIGEDYTLRASHGCLLQYDGTSSRWRIVAADRLGRFTEAYTTSTATTASISATSPATNVGVALVPKGNGPLLGQVPDGTSTGGNARGQYAVDWQRIRTNASDVASGNYSTIPGGRRCEASGTYSFATGFRAVASGNGSAAFGGSGAFSTGATATGDNSFAFGTGADATAVNAFAFNSDASAQNAIAINSTLSNGANKYGQVSIGGLNHLHLSELTLGTGAQELFLDGDGGSLRATIPSNSAWIAEVRVLARVNSVGTGVTIVAGDIYAATYKCVIANKGGTTALIGTVQADMAAQSDASMSGASFTIAADNTNDALTVTYNPGPNEGTTTQVNVYATIWYNEF